MDAQCVRVSLPKVRLAGLARVMMSEGRCKRVVHVALLLSLPTVATLQLPAHAAEPGPRSRRAQQQQQQQQLSRGDVLRGALAAAATWVPPSADT